MKRFVPRIRLAAFAGALLLFIGSECRAQSITVTFSAQGNLSTSGSPLFVYVTVQSVYELQKVTAQVETRSADLVYSSCAFKEVNGICFAGWSGTVDVSGLTRGTHTVSAIATDVYGTTGRAQRDFIYDELPKIIVQEPRADSVARPVVHVSAQCTDDNPSGCTSLTVATADQRLFIAGGTTSVDKLMSLEGYDGQSVVLKFEAKDSTGRTFSVQRRIFVEKSPNLTEVDHTEGVILDADSTRFLSLDCGNRDLAEAVMKIHDRVTKANVSITLPAPLSCGWSTAPLPYGFLTPSGAIFAASNQIYEWRDGQLRSLGNLGGAWSSLVVKGNFAIWQQGDVLIRRDLSSGTNLTISAGTVAPGDVSANGDVAYLKNTNNVFRYRNGDSMALTNNPTAEGVQKSDRVVTDGVNVAYRNVKGDGQTWAPALYTSAEEMLAPFRSAHEWAGRDFQLNSGWTAFTQLGNTGILETWIRSPQGTKTRVAVFNNDTFPTSITPGGELTVMTAAPSGPSRHYWAKAGVPPLDIGSAFYYNGQLGFSYPRIFWMDGQLFVAIGDAFFRAGTSNTLKRRPGQITSQ